MDDLMIPAKSEREVNRLISIAQILGNNTGRNKMVGIRPC